MSARKASRNVFITAKGKGRNAEQKRGGQMVVQVTGEGCCVFVYMQRP
jgi:hypothetical protein